MIKNIKFKSIIKLKEKIKKLTMKKKFFKKLFIYSLFFILNYYNSIISVYAMINPNEKNYRSYVIKSITDDNIPSDSGNSSNDTLGSIMQFMQFIPGLSLIIPSFSCIIKTGIEAFLSSDLLTGDADFLGSVLGVIGVISSLASMSPTESNGAIAIQSVFNSNLYCKYQKIYYEETEYITKTEADGSTGGYPIFPIYPIIIPIKKGQCVVGDILESSFKKMNNLNAKETKCSFSFSPTDDQCLLDINIPIMIEKSLQDSVTDTVCFSSSLKKKLKRLAKKKIAGKVAKFSFIELITLGVTGAELFVDERLALDPISLMGVLMMQITFELVSTLPKELKSMNFACAIARLSIAQVIQYISQITITAVADSNYEKAKESLPVYKFCGHNWLSYDKEWIYDDDKKPDTYPRKGVNEKSYYKDILEKINTGNVKNDITNRNFREYIYGGKEYVSGIPEKENYAKKIAGTVVANDYDYEYCIDPRPDDISGLNYSVDNLEKEITNISSFSNTIDISQRYYMRGNDKGNFACNRFFYDGQSPCIVPEKEVSNKQDDTNNFKKEEIGSFYGTKYYKISGEETIDICTRTFDMARKCCKYRSKHLVCLEKINNETDRDVEASTFCFSHVIDSYGAGDRTVFEFLVNRDSSKYGPTCKLDGLEFEAAKKTNTDYVCVYSYGLCPYNFKLNAGLNYKASFCDSNELEGFTHDNAGFLQRRATHKNAQECRLGFFSAKRQAEYEQMDSAGGGGDNTNFPKEMYSRVSKDMKDFNSKDFELIYNLTQESLNEDSQNRVDNAKLGYNSSYEEGVSEEKEIYEIIPNSHTKTDFYGKIKNLCQYRAHCIEVEKEENLSDDSNITGSLFVDSSCTGKSSNSRNISPGHTGSISIQFSAPVTECIFETLKNLINGIAGVSLCADGSSNNSYGYCGLDTEETVLTHVKNKNNAYLDLKYGKKEGVHIIKGQKLPDSYNPFYKLQKYLKTTIKAFLTLFLVIYFYKKLLLGDLENLLKPENISAWIFNAFKFAIMIWLIFYNGWQDGVYDKLVNFATAGYSFINNIFVKSIRNPKNQMVIFSENAEESIILRVVEVNNINTSVEAEPVMLCIKYDILDNVSYSRRDINTQRCERGFYSNYKINSTYEEGSEIFVRKATKEERRTSENVIISNNQELSRLIYYIDTYNSDISKVKKLKIQIKDGTGWTDLKNSKLWNQEYDGCYFDTTEYKENKNYLAAFDTLDCKLAKYLGYSVNMAGPNILLYSVIMLVPSFFFPDTVITKVINALGGFIFGLMMTFIFMIFNIIIKAVYTFTASFFNLSILILISPIILPLMFFERTKRIFDTWLEYIADNIFKPMINFASLVIYTNFMDMILLKGVIFKNHSEKGRGAIVTCKDGNSSFLCLINGIPGVQQISILVNSNFVSVILDLAIVFIFFKLSDQMLTDIENISNSIFRNLSADKQSSSNLSASGTPIGKSIANSVKSAMSTGSKLETLRHDYINNAPGALLDKASKSNIKGLRKIGKGFDKMVEKRDKLLNKADSFFKHVKRVASFKTKSIFKKMTLKDRRDYYKSKRMLNKNKELYKEKVKKYRKIEAMKNKIKRLKEKAKFLSSQERKKLEDEIKKIENKISKLNKSKTIRKYYENIDFVTNNLRGDYTKKMIKHIRKNAKKQNDKYGSYKEVLEKLIKKNIKKQIAKGEEHNINKIVNYMNILKEFSINIDDDDKEFIKNNINKKNREEYNYHNKVSKKTEKKKEIISKIKNNIKKLNELGIDTSQEDSNTIMQYEKDNIK